MKHTYTMEQNCILRDALMQSGVTHRLMLVEAMACGNSGLAYLYARLIVKNERAAHLVWQLSSHFPTAE